MKTTITEYKKTTCGKCGGKGNLSHYQHVKGGECFSCSGTGLAQTRESFEREMTDDEILIAFEQAGFVIMDQEYEQTGDWLIDLFAGNSKKDLAAGARIMLQAV